mgnify:CR=1 FL=1
MAAIIDSPDFMLHYVDVKNLKLHSKLYLFLKGILVGAIFKKFHRGSFCLLLNCGESYVRCFILSLFTGFATLVESAALLVLYVLIVEVIIFKDISFEDIFTV